MGLTLNQLEYTWKIRILCKEQINDSVTENYRQQWKRPGLFCWVLFTYRVYFLRKLPAQICSLKYVMR